MKKISLKILAAFAALQLAPVAANAGLVVDFYAGTTAGLGNAILTLPSESLMDDIEKPAQSYGLALGVDIPVVRVEAEYNYLTSDAANLHAGMLNAYLKMFTFPVIKPYIGAGIGTVFGGDIADDSEDAESSIAYQGMVGLQFSIPTTPLYLDVEGRVFYAPSVFTIDAIDKDVSFAQYDIRAKLRYVF